MASPAPKLWTKMASPILKLWTKMASPAPKLWTKMASPIIEVGDAILVHSFRMGDAISSFLAFSQKVLIFQTNGLRIHDMFNITENISKVFVT